MLLRAERTSTIDIFAKTSDVLSARLSLSTYTRSTVIAETVQNTTKGWINSSKTLLSLFWNKVKFLTTSLLTRVRAFNTLVRLSSIITTVCTQHWHLLKSSSSCPKSGSKRCLHNSSESGLLKAWSQGHVYRSQMLSSTIKPWWICTMLGQIDVLRR